VLVARLPPGAFRVAAALGSPLARRGFVLAHAALDEADPGGLLAELAGNAPAEVVAGLVAAARSPVHLADAGGAAGSAVSLGLRDDVPAVAGMALGCSPLGPPHRITSGLGSLILGLDGRPALEVMTDELGDLYRRAGGRFAPNLWLAEANKADDATRAGGEGAPRVRRVTVADAGRGALRVEGGRLDGCSVRLMRPDPAGSLDRLAALARGLRGRLAGARATAGLYLASRFRGRELFGPGVDELALLREALGGVPLIGLVTDAEVFAGALHECAGVLVLLGEPAGGTAP
jgi:small ligand-binding sensory domain FIST